MAATDNSVIEKLENLFKLQTIHSSIDQIQVLKGELPIEVSDLEDEIVGLKTRLSKLNGDLEDQTAKLASHNTNIKEAEDLIAKYNVQMDNVKNNREFDALTKELELQKLEIELSQKKIAELNIAVEAKKETLKASEERLATREKDIEAKKEALEKIIVKTEKQEAKLIKSSQTAKNKIESRLLEAYERIRSRYKNGLAVVTVDRDSCGGCFNRIPPQLQLEITRRNRVIACEHCGRVLIDDETAVKIDPSLAKETA